MLFWSVSDGFLVRLLRVGFGLVLIVWLVDLVVWVEFGFLWIWVWCS